MERNFALIKDGVVFNVIVATQQAINEIGLSNLKADAVIDITGTDKGIGDLYDGQNLTKAALLQPDYSEGT